MAIVQGKLVEKIVLTHLLGELDSWFQWVLLQLQTHKAVTSLVFINVMTASIKSFLANLTRSCISSHSKLSGNTE